MSLAQALDRIEEQDFLTAVLRVAQGGIVEVLPERGPRWLLDSRPQDLPGQYKLWRVGGVVIERGPRAELVAQLNERLQARLAAHDGRALVPGRIHELRLAQVQLLAAMRE